MSEESTPAIETTPSKDERTWAMLCHFSTYIGFILPIWEYYRSPYYLVIKTRRFTISGRPGKRSLEFPD